MRGRPLGPGHRDTRCDALPARLRHPLPGTASLIARRVEGPCPFWRARRQRRSVYRAGRRPPPITDRTAIVVDDGIATGATPRAALRAVRRRKPKFLVLAVPVVPLEILQSLRSKVDEVVCLATPYPFGAIGRFYTDFRQLDDLDVREYLERAGAKND